MAHAPGFLKMVNEAKPYVKELTIEEAREHLAKNKDADTRRCAGRFRVGKDHAAEAVHLSKGILERDLEEMFPDTDRELIMYCGGGYRSILTAAVAQKMGYRNVFSLMGGYKGLVKANWTMKAES